MIDSLSGLVEDLAQRIGRSVAIDDASLRLLAHSSHFGDVDPARMGSLVGRRVSGPLRDYVMSRRIQGWTQPTELTAVPELGMERARLGYPLRSRYELLGIMWVVQDAGMSEADRAACVDVARAAERILARRLQSQLESDTEVESLIFALIDAEPGVRADAAVDLDDLGVFGPATDYAVLSVRIEPAGTGDDDPDDVVETVRRALAHAVAAQHRGSASYAVTSTEAICLVAARTGFAADELRTLAERVRAEIGRLSAPLAARIRVGIGDAVPRLTDVWIGYDQAASAARIARDRDDGVALWEDHPLDAYLRAVVRSDRADAMVPAVLRQRVAAASDSTLGVVAAFLDRAGNVAEAAASLHMHRTSVYYRLRRFEESTGLDLDNGRDRLLVHLWLSLRHH